jgi:predicted N-acyltransferase
VFLGRPVSASQSHLRLREGADTGAVLRVLDVVCRDLARRHRAPLVVWKEFDAWESARLKGLADLGYRRMESPPMNYLSTPYGCFEGLCGAMRSRYRRNVRGSMRKFRDAGLRVDHVAGTEAARWFADDRLHPLYLAVLEHAGGFLETLPPAFFRQLFELWGGQAILTLVRREDCVVAWGCSLLCPPAFYMLVMGLDYEANGRGDVYFNLVFACLDYAMRQGAREVWIGANADQFKARLGCAQHRRCFYVKGRGLLGRLLPLASGWLFPAMALRRPKRAMRRDPRGLAASAAEAENVARPIADPTAAGGKDAPR